MTGHRPIELTDELIERMVAGRAASRAPLDLVGSIVSAAAATPQRRRFALPVLIGVSRLRPAWLLIAVVVALVAFVAAVVGASLLRSPTPIGGGGLLAVGELDGPPGCCGSIRPTSMQVFGLDAVTGERIPILDLPITTSDRYAPATWVRWSADRKHALLFDSGGEVRGIVDVASHVLTTLRPDPIDTGFPNGDSEIVWDPSGDRIGTLASGTAGSPAFVIFDVSGHEIRRLALPSGSSAAEPRWSPDGSAIVLSGCRPCGSVPNGAASGAAHEHLFILPIDGSPVHELLDESRANLFGAAWSPDGSKIVYQTVSGITIVDVKDGRQQTLTRGNDQDPAWSPDGRRIAFTRRNADAMSQGIYLVDVDGTHLTRLTDGDDDKADWSPDGSLLVFGRATTDVTEPDVWVVAADGSSPRFLVRNATAAW